MPDWLPLTGFAIAASVTPGPNVLMVAAGAARHGARAVLPLMAGITAGFGLMLLAVGMGLAAPLAASPGLHAALRWVAVGWLLWLAWKIATAPPAGEATSEPPLGFAGAMLFQWVNPKAWMVAGAAMAGYTTAAAPLVPQVAVVALVFAVVSMPCLAVWAALGEGARRWLAPGRTMRRLNLAMGILLALSVLPLLR